MMNSLVLYPTQEDKERINALLQEMGNIIARSNTQGLEIDWEFWATEVFGSATGYGHSDNDQDSLPKIFQDFIGDLEIL